jgi:hypothetical protein
MLSHVTLHLALCGPDAAGSTVPVHVRVSDRLDQSVVDRVFDTANEGGSRTVAFDIPFGVYKVQSDVPGTSCAAAEFFSVLPGHDRNVTQTLDDAESNRTPLAIPVIIDGTGPPAFHARKPQFVTIDADAAACQRYVPDPIPARVIFEHDGDAYYASLFPAAAFASGKSLLLALQFETPEHAHQYIDIMPLEPRDRPWPLDIHVNVGQKQMDALDGKAVDVLFCPPWRITGAV